MKNLLLIPTLMMLVLLSACEPERQEIFYGEEECAHCSMIIADPQFAGQLLTSTGNHHNFDTIECMAAYVETDAIDDEDIHSLWVASFDEEKWIRADEAYFLRSDNLASPMSMNLTAHEGSEIAQQHQQEYTGEVLGWDEIKNLVRQEWLSHH